MNVKHICFTLSFIFILLVLLISCSGNKPADGEVTAYTEAVETEKISNFMAISKKYADIDYNSYIYRVLCGDPGNKEGIGSEVYVETQTGDVLYDAVYKRNIQTEELLNIKIAPVWENNDINAVYKNSVMAGDNNFDVALDRLDFMLNLGAEGLNINYYDIDTISLEDTWWNAGIVKNFTMFKNKLYAIAGDLNWLDDYAIHFVIFNKVLCDDLGLEYPYDSVCKGTWYFDTFAAMVKTAVHDLNGDGKLTLTDDQIGFANHSHSILHMLYIYGEPMSYTDEEGLIKINYSERMVDIVETLYEFIVHNEAVIVDPNYGYSATFKQGRLLFRLGGGTHLEALRDMEDDFGILPMPKGDESQTSYTAYVSNGSSSAFAIPITNDDIYRTGVIMDTLSAFSSDTVTPAIYDVVLESKLIRDVKSQEMLPYIFKSYLYDWAGDLTWADSLRGVYSSLLDSPANNYISQMESKLPSIQKKLDEFIASYKNVG